MDATTARTMNVRELVAKAGGPTAFANSYGSGRWSQAQVSQWTADDPKSIGGRLARAIEAEVGLEKGALDHRIAKSSDYHLADEDVINTSRQLVRHVHADELLIPKAPGWASMGNGALISNHIDAVESMRVRISELRKLLPSFSAPRNLRLLDARGPSMEPTFKDGDVLIVDVGITEVKLDAVYVMSKKDELFVKRLTRHPVRDGVLVMTSDNKDHPPFEIDVERDGFRLEGLVLMVWNARRL